MSACNALSAAAAHRADMDRPASVRRVAGPVGGWAKRMVDLLFVTLALPIVFPMMLALAILIKMNDGGPILYSHRRIGYAGRSFPCYKFRSMVRHSDRLLERYLAEDPEMARQWREYRKLRRDPRVTPFGKFLRKSSLDELPQLINVLCGDMSIIGPRPITDEELQKYSSYAEDYLAARPGLTGLWQVTGRSTTTFAERIFMDHTYVRGWSFEMDMKILFRTPKAMFRTTQAY